MIYVRKCDKSDEKEVLDICYKTGYMGTDLSGINQFNDKLLFGYLFCLYYVRYETSNCFIAVDQSNNKIVGYIIGTHDTLSQKRKAFLKMGWKIILRLLIITSWKYPETVSTIIQFLKTLDIKNNSNMVYNKYPAHFHINIASEYQRMGIGEQLLTTFEEHIKKYSKGIHLITSSRNTNAVHFYKKMGYKVFSEKHSKMWRDIKDLKIIIFTKCFD